MGCHSGEFGALFDQEKRQQHRAALQCITRAGRQRLRPAPVRLRENQPVLITVTVTFNANPISSVTVGRFAAWWFPAPCHWSPLAAVVYTNRRRGLLRNLAAGTATLIATMTDSGSKRRYHRTLYGEHQHRVRNLERSGVG